jgi:hypothetical protein
MYKHLLRVVTLQSCRNTHTHTHTFTLIHMVKKAKGVSQVVVKENISFDDYKNCVLNEIPKNAKINAIRTSKTTN